MNPQAWTSYYNGRFRDYSIRFIDGTGFFVALGLGVGSQYLIVKLFLPNFYIILPTAFITSMCIGLVFLSPKYFSLQLYIIAIADGLAASFIVSKKLNTGIVNQIKLEYNKQHFNETDLLQLGNLHPLNINIVPRMNQNHFDETSLVLKDLKSFKEFLKIKSKTKIIEFFRNQIYKPVEFSRALTCLDMIIGGGKMSGFEERVFIVRGSAEPLHLQRSKIDFPAEQIKLQKHKLDFLKNSIPLLQAFFQFSMKKEERIKKNKLLLNAIHNNTTLPSDLTAIVLSYTQVFIHPAFAKSKSESCNYRTKNEVMQNQEQNTDIIRREIVKCYDQEIEALIKKHPSKRISI